MAGNKKRYGRSNPNRPPKKSTPRKPAPPPTTQAMPHPRPPHIDPRLAQLGSGNLNADVALMQQMVAEQNFPVMAPDVGLTALTHEARIELIASLDLELTLTSVAELLSSYDIATTTDQQAQRIERRFVDSILEPWGATLAKRVAKGDVLIPPGISGGLLSREDETYGSRIEAVLG